MDDSSPERCKEGELQAGRLPRHIAIIMDGNGRWARERGLPRVAGHEAGMKAVREVVRTCGDLGIPVLTLYAFSTENWSRPQSEVDFLMELLVRYLRSDLEELHRANVQIRVFGERQGLSPLVRREIELAVERTRANTGLVLGLAFNYGGRQELTRAFRQLAEQVERGTLRPADITPELISRHLYTAGLPDPDLIIRSSGEFRLSNFLLWQSAYAEFWWTPDYWPDFTREHLLCAIRDYQRRERRYGGVSSC